MGNCKSSIPRINEIGGIREINTNYNQETTNQETTNQETTNQETNNQVTYNQENHLLEYNSINNYCLFIENVKYLVKKQNVVIQNYIENQIDFKLETTFSNKKILVYYNFVKHDIDIIFLDEISFDFFTPKNPDYFNDKECSICLEKANHITHGGMMPVALKCHHVFHYDCIKKWYENKKTCPNCCNNIYI